MQFFSNKSNLENKFINLLMKRGKKVRVEKLVYNFFYYLNTSILLNFWYFNNNVMSLRQNMLTLRASNSIGRANKSSHFKIFTYFFEKYKIERLILIFYLFIRVIFLSVSIGIYQLYSIYSNDKQKSTINELSYAAEGNMLYSKQLEVIKRTKYVFNDLNKKLFKILNVCIFKTCKGNITKYGDIFYNFQKYIESLWYFYFNFSAFYSNFLVSKFIIPHIVYSLLPILGVRMTSVESKRNLKKKGRKRKPYGVPILLNTSAQLSYAFSFFKKGSGIKTSKWKKKSFEDNFKSKFIYEMLNFFFNKNTNAVNLKLKLYKDVIQYRSNFHYRWLAAY